MTIYQKIDKFIKDKKAYSELSKHTSIGNRGLRSALENETLTLKVYMEICNYFKLQYESFFDNNYKMKNELEIATEPYLKYNSNKKEVNFIDKSDEYQKNVLEKLTVIVELLEKSANQIK
jgi:hypothetical protein